MKRWRLISIAAEVICWCTATSLVLFAVILVSRTTWWEMFGRGGLSLLIMSCWLVWVATDIRVRRIIVLKREENRER